MTRRITAYVIYSLSHSNRIARKQYMKDRDYTFAAKNHENKKCVKAINNDTNEVSYYNSMYAVQQHLGINVGIVKMVCEGINNCKSGISKKDGKSYKFEYVRKRWICLTIT